MYGLWPTYMSVYHMHAWNPQRPEGGIRSSGTSTQDGCELPWVLGIGPGSSVKAASVASQVCV